MERLRKLRESRGLLQKDIAELLGVDRTTYVKYETGKSEPGNETLVKLAKFFNVPTDYLLDNDTEDSAVKRDLWVPVLGRIIAGMPKEVMEEILDYEEITPEMTSQGEHFGLQIKGDSMEPRMREGDVVIVRKQSDVDNGDIAVILVNGDEATIKRIKKRPDGIMLVPLNPNYEVMFYNNEEIKSLPVSIIGKAVELRAKL